MKPIFHSFSFFCSFLDSFTVFSLFSCDFNFLAFKFYRNQLKSKINEMKLGSFSEKLSLVVSAVTGISNSFMIIVVNVLMSDDSWEFDMMKFFGLEKAHLFEFAHALNKLRIFVKSIGLLFN